MSGEILRELRVGLRARDGLLRVLRMLLARTGKRDQRGRKFHLRVISLQCGAAKLNCFLDRKSTRLNSSHSQISYAVFCLKKKKKTADPVHVLGDRVTPKRT